MSGNAAGKNMQLLSSAASVGILRKIQVHDSQELTLLLESATLISWQVAMKDIIYQKPTAIPEAFITHINIFRCIKN